jgi:hypothetical protein
LQSSDWGLSGFLGEVEVAEEADQGGEARRRSSRKASSRSLLFEWAHLHRSAHACSRDLRPTFDRRIEVLGLVEEVAGERFP